MRMELSDRAIAYALQLLAQFDSHISAKTLWKSINDGLPRYRHPSDELLTQFDGHISAKTLWKSFNGGLPRHRHPGDEPFSALHCISYFGIAEVTNTLVRMKRWEVNEVDGAGTTPLMWAARQGHEEVVRLLLRQKHIQPDLQDGIYGRTALSWAARNGCEGVVKVFLGPRFVNPASIGRRWGRVARAIDVLFLGRYVKPDRSCGFGRTPLSWAADNGHEGIVKLLLDRKDVNPEIPDTTYGQTPLSCAAENGREGVVKLLLGRKDVNPDSLSKSGRTPLSWAAANGHEGIVKLLLDRKDVNPEITDTSYGQAPLSWAAENGREGAAKLT